MVEARVSLGDVARKSGVSKASASRALNGRNGVRPDVRDRILIVAQSLGYRPNLAARNLRGGRASVLGLVLGSGEREVEYCGPWAGGFFHCCDMQRGEKIIATENLVHRL